MAQADSDKRLTEINAELSRILETKIEFLTQTLSETQRLTQKIANTELEIQRNASQHASLGDEGANLEKELGVMSGRVKAAQEERDAKQQDKYAKEKETQRLEWEIADKIKANDEAGEKIRGLESELEHHEKDNKKLQGRVEVLEEGVERMRKVREEYLSKISSLDQEMKGLAGVKE